MTERLEQLRAKRAASERAGVGYEGRIKTIKAEIERLERAARND